MTVPAGSRGGPAAQLPEPAGGVAAWAGAVLRIAAYGALLVLLASVFGTLWRALGVPTDGAWFFAHWLVTAAAALLAGVIMIRYVDGRPAAALGIGVSRTTARHVALGTAIGVAALAVAVLALLVSGSLRYSAEPASPGQWLAVVAAQAAFFTVAAFAEEAMFRGYAFQVLARSTGPMVATVLSSVLFALAHGANPEVGALAMINIFMAGVLLAMAYLRTLSLWFATALHTGWNWAMASLFDLPVSGIAGFDTPGYDAAVRGPVAWTGGAFGPEGGLVATLGFGVAVLALLRLRMVRPDSAIVAAGPLVLDRERSLVNGG